MTSGFTRKRKSGSRYRISNDFFFVIWILWSFSRLRVFYFFLCLEGKQQNSMYKKRKDYSFKPHLLFTLNESRILSSTCYYAQFPCGFIPILSSEIWDDDWTCFEPPQILKRLEVERVGIFHYWPVLDVKKVPRNVLRKVPENYLLGTFSKDLLSNYHPGSG